MQVVDVAAQLAARGLPRDAARQLLQGGEVPLVLSLLVGGAEGTSSQYQVRRGGCAAVRLWCCAAARRRAGRSQARPRAQATKAAADAGATDAHAPAAAAAAGAGAAAQ